MEFKVLNIEGRETGKTVQLPEEVFAIEPNNHAIYMSVKLFLANQRHGTHKAKERAEISLSTRKIKKQKGTGGARAGSLKAPTFVGGGRVFGPRPRSYSFKLNKKVKTLARASALTYKAREAKITVLEDFTFQTPKTKSYLAMLKNLALSGKKTLLVTADKNDNVYLSARNLPKTKVVSAESLNTYEILHADNVIFCESSISKLS